jgi:hypothetical protein
MAAAWYCLAPIPTNALPKAGQFSIPPVPWAWHQGAARAALAAHFAGVMGPVTRQPGITAQAAHIANNEDRRGRSRYGGATLQAEKVERFVLRLPVRKPPTAKCLSPA